MLGYAWQCGRIPLARDALEQAIRLNGRAVEANLRAFRAGRARAIKGSSDTAPAEDFDTFVERRTSDLEAYWNRSYGVRYASFVRTVRKAAHSFEGSERLAWAVARSAYRLMAYKDEYEVARLYSNGKFRAALSHELEGVRSIRIQLSPPLFARKDPASGRPRKISVGGWIFPVFRALAACRGLREGPLDLFARTAERRLEREIRDLFIARMTSLAGELRQDNIQAAIELAESALQVRGFGPVKEPAARALLSRLQTATR
jgi:indolepyruvate ferredoxin oxidoreductase